MQHATIIEADTAPQAYLKLIDTVTAYGYSVSPRGMGTRELPDTTVIIHDPLAASLRATTRNPARAIMATEALQLLAGVSSLEQLDLASRGRFSQFADRGRLRGAYGPRTHAQLLKVAEKLREDADTRQAVVSIWRGDEHAEASRDVPCTVYLRFSIRDSELRLDVHMRSSDVYLGIPYDWFMFTQVQAAMAESLCLRVGPLVHHADSQHIYDRDLERALGVYFGRIDAENDLPVFAQYGAPLEVTSRQALGVVLGKLNGDVEWTSSMATYVKWVPNLLAEGMTASFCHACRYVTVGKPCDECA